MKITTTQVTATTNQVISTTVDAYIAMTALDGPAVRERRGTATTSQHLDPSPHCMA